MGLNELINGTPLKDKFGEATAPGDPRMTMSQVLEQLAATDHNGHRRPHNLTHYEFWGNYANDTMNEFVNEKMGYIRNGTNEQASGSVNQLDRMFTGYLQMSVNNILEPFPGTEKEYFLGRRSAVQSAMMGTGSGEDQHFRAAVKGLLGEAGEQRYQDIMNMERERSGLISRHSSSEEITKKADEINQASRALSQDMTRAFLKSAVESGVIKRTDLDRTDAWEQEKARSIPTAPKPGM